MMHADTSDQQVSDNFDLGEVSVDLVKSLQLLLDEFANQAFCIAVSKFNLGVERLSILERGLS